MKTLVKFVFMFTLLMSVLLIKAGVGGGGAVTPTDPQCLAGGPGASTCDYSITLALGLGEAKCSVSCTAPTYACCYTELVHVKCVCKSSSASQ